MSSPSPLPPVPPKPLDLFIVGLEEGEFAELPKYMRGRLTLAKINSCVEQLNAVFRDKYVIMASAANPNKLSNENRQRFYVAKSFYYL